MAGTDENLISSLLTFINAEVSLVHEPVEAGTDLLLTGAVDSLGVVTVTQWIEDELGFEVDPTEVVLENFQTVELMVAFCRSKLGAVAEA